MPISSVSLKAGSVTVGFLYPILDSTLANGINYSVSRGRGQDGIENRNKIPWRTGEGNGDIRDQTCATCLHLL